MSPHDVYVLRERLRYHKGVLKQQQQLPKPERDAAVIAKTLPVIARLTEWLRGKDVQPQAPVPVIKKSEFRDQYKKEFDIAEPGAVIKIDDIAGLDKAWPNIRGKNVLVEAPKEVKDEITKRIRKIRESQKVNGFR